MIELSNDSDELLPLATQHVRDILSLAILHTPQQSVLVIVDTLSPLARLLTQAYRCVLPTATFIDFYQMQEAEVLSALQALQPADLVVLIQSSSFRLNAFRLRVELFHQGLKVIEHPHVARMEGIEMKYYVDALAYDANYYHHIGHTLKNIVDTASGAVVESGGERLIFASEFEPAKLNIGDYAQMKNKGGQFPIGEVFTEAKDLEAVNGRVRIFAFGDTTFSVNKVEKPITLVVAKGRVIEAIDSTAEFDKVLANIRADEGEVWLRELGFGLNPAFTPEKIVTDIGTYERMCGIHLSLGAKHGVYKKPHFKRTDTWHHVDVFAITNAVYLDEKMVCLNHRWQV